MYIITCTIGAGLPPPAVSTNSRCTLSHIMVTYVYCAVSSVCLMRRDVLTTSAALPITATTWYSRDCHHPTLCGVVVASTTVWLLLCHCHRHRCLCVVMTVVTAAAYCHRHHLVCVCVCCVLSPPATLYGLSVICRHHHPIGSVCLCVVVVTAAKTVVVVYLVCVCCCRRRRCCHCRRRHRSHLMYMLLASSLLQLPCVGATTAATCMCVCVVVVNTSTIER